MNSLSQKDMNLVADFDENSKVLHPLIFYLDTYQLLDAFTIKYFVQCTSKVITRLSTY